MEDKSKFRGFITFLASVRGDLANITAPPYFLAPRSVVEVPSCWTESPKLFISPALEPDPQKRSLLVLKWILCSLKSQFYIGGDSKAGIKKPLNAFLGEIFSAQWTDDTTTTSLLAEQVSHHPPVTACYMWNDEHGVRGEGYTRVEMNFNGNINIRQYGHAILSLEKFEENYLVPFPNAKVGGFLSGSLYPELHGTYHIVSSSGFESEITFSGKGFFSGQRNSFHARMYRSDDLKKRPIFNVRGRWNEAFTITDAEGHVVETCELNTSAAPIKLDALDEQDPWESRRAWKETIRCILNGEMHGTVVEKGKVEEAQRAMRRHEKAKGIKFDAKFFHTMDGKDRYAMFEELAAPVGSRLVPEKTAGVWRVDTEKVKNATKPYRGTLTPLG